MSIQYKTMDVTTVERGIIPHGVNCRGRMGSGVAKVIRNKWPVVFDQYSIIPTGPKSLGVAQLVPIKSNELYVVNCFTQVNYGADGRRYASLEAVATTLRSTFIWARDLNLPIYMPKIGAGLGGLSWDEGVEPVITSLVTEFPSVEVTVCEWG